MEDWNGTNVKENVSKHFCELTVLVGNNRRLFVLRNPVFWAMEIHTICYAQPWYPGPFLNDRDPRRESVTYAVLNRPERNHPATRIHFHVALGILMRPGTCQGSLWVKWDAQKRIEYDELKTQRKDRMNSMEINAIGATRFQIHQIDTSPNDVIG